MPWTCPGCQQTVMTPFCARCGEEPVKPHELTLRGLAEKVLHAFTNIDAKTMRTARCLVRHPGELTASWVQGFRKPYLAPFPLFLVANLIFFGVQWLTGQVVLSSSLDSHLHQQDWSEPAQRLLEQRLAATGMTLQQFAPLFDRAVLLNAKSLIVLMTVPFALLLPLVFLRERRPFMVHIVFSLHLYTFLLLLFCLSMVAGRLSELLGFGGMESAAVDNVLSIFNLAASTIYLHLATRRVYRGSGASRVLRTLLLALAVPVIVVGYRFALFLITLYTV